VCATKGGTLPSWEFTSATRPVIVSGPPSRLWMRSIEDGVCVVSVRVRLGWTFKRRRRLRAAMGIPDCGSGAGIFGVCADVPVMIVQEGEHNLSLGIQVPLTKWPKMGIFKFFSKPGADRASSTQRVTGMPTEFKFVVFVLFYAALTVLA